MKINNRIETIFAQAAALGNCNRFKSSIHCIKDRIYLLNSDNTLLLKFPLRQRESPFSIPISFSSSDYDSKQFHEENGRIVFISSNENYERRKICGGKSKIEVEKIWQNFPLNLSNKVGLDKSLCSLLEEDLSHIELSIVNGKFRLIQRDIYSGTIIEISKNQNSGLGLNNEKININSFGPIGLRTNDFMSLFTFQPNIQLGFEEDKEYCSIKCNNNLFPMEGVIAHCIYDELGTIEETSSGWRKESENRGSEQSVNSKISKNASTKRKRRC